MGREQHLALCVGIEEQHQAPMAKTVVDEGLAPGLRTTSVSVRLQHGVHRSMKNARRAIREKPIDID